MDFNPWEVEAVTDFSYFCCPECEFKTKNVPSFLTHANENHPRSKNFCESKVKYESEDQKENLIFESEPNQQLLEFINDFKNEFDESDEPLKKPKRKRKIKDENDSSIQCSICELKFTTIYDLCIHNYEIHQEDKNSFICPLCQHFTKGGKKCIKDHIRRKHETSKISCPECNRLIKEDSLIAHMESSHSTKIHKKHKCSYDNCEFESNNSTSIANHVKYMHPSDLTQHPFKCDKCEKTFPYASGLQQHVDKVHLKLKSYVCEMCGKGFNSRIEFNEHQALPNCNFMTSTDVIFQCDKCENSFNTVKGILDIMKCYMEIFHPIYQLIQLICVMNVLRYI